MAIYTVLTPLNFKLLEKPKSLAVKVIGRLETTSVSSSTLTLLPFLKIILLILLFE